MPPQKADRRSLRTQTAARQALVGLLQEKHYSAITVQDILDRADIGRSTFYAHYESKEDLLISSVSFLMNQFIDHGEHSEDGIPSTIGLFEHVQENRHLYQGLIRGQRLDFLFDKGQKRWAERVQEHLAKGVEAGHLVDVPLPVMSQFVTGAFMMLLKWWADNKMPYSPQEMDQMYRQLVMSGVRVDAQE